MRFIIFRNIWFILIMGIVSGYTCSGSEPLSDPLRQKFDVTFGANYTDFLPGGTFRIEVRFRNRTSNSEIVSQEIVLLDKDSLTAWKTVINLELHSEQSVTIPLLVPVPKTAGIFNLTLGRRDEMPNGLFPSFVFNVVQPRKSSRLSRILVYSPEFEVKLNRFLKVWGIKAPNFSWAQVLLLGKTGWARYISGDPDITQLISRSLRREMSVIFLDFGSPDNSELTPSKIALPFDVKVSFNRLESSEKSFFLNSGHPELTFGMDTSAISQLNGNNGFAVPAEELVFEGKGVKINALATSGINPVRFPLVELIPRNGKGKLYICQLLTHGRIDEALQPSRYDPENTVYDGLAVQLLLNLISTSVGDDLLK